MSSDDISEAFFKHLKIVALSNFLNDLNNIINKLWKVRFRITKSQEPHLMQYVKDLDEVIKKMQDLRNKILKELKS